MGLGPGLLREFFRRRHRRRRPLKVYPKMQRFPFRFVFGVPDRADRSVSSNQYQRFKFHQYLFYMIPKIDDDVQKLHKLQNM